MPRSTRLPCLAVLALGGCGILSTTDSSAVEIGTVHVTAFDRFGEPAHKAEVLVHDADGQLVGRTKLGSDGTGYVKSVEDATVTVVINTKTVSAFVDEGGELTTFAAVPLGASLHIGAADDSVKGSAVDVDFVLPAGTFHSPNVDLGCHFVGGFVQAPQFQLHVPPDCTRRPRTVLVSARVDPTGDSDVDGTVFSVRHGVELTKGAVIEMPPFQPSERIAIDIANATDIFARVKLFADHETLGLFAFSESLPHNSAHAEVPVAAWEATRYEVELDVRTTLARVELGSPRSVSFARSDFLVKPVRRPFSDLPFDFIFTGAPDYRGLELRYLVGDGNTRVFWTLFAPPADEPMTVPELPDDLKDLSPVGSIKEQTLGAIFENSEHADYLDFLAADPAQLVPGVHRAATVDL